MPCYPRPAYVKKRRMDPVQFIKVMVLENHAEAQVLGSMLEQLDIPHRIRTFHDTAYNGLFQVQKGWGEIYAPPQFETEILDILADIRSQESV